MRGPGLVLLVVAASLAACGGRPGLLWVFPDDGATVLPADAAVDGPLPRDSAPQEDAGPLPACTFVWLSVCGFS